jgi:hypothetical protein
MHRVQVTPAKRGKGNKVKVPNETQDQTPAERRASMTWAQRLKRVFMLYIPVPHPYGAAYGCANRLSCRFVNIDIETCRACGGAVKVVACIEDPVVIEKILTHLNETVASAGTGLLPEIFAGARSTASSGFAKEGKPWVLDEKGIFES